MSYTVLKRPLEQKGMFHISRFIDLFEAFGDLFASLRPLDPPRYPDDARQQDLVRIGRDMRKAMDQCKVTPHIQPLHDRVTTHTLPLHDVEISVRRNKPGVSRVFVCRSRPGAYRVVFHRNKIRGSEVRIETHKYAHHIAGGFNDEETAKEA